MSQSPNLLYSDVPYEGSPYIIELYDNGSMHIVHNQEQEETIIISPEEIFPTSLYLLMLADQNSPKVQKFVELFNKNYNASIFKPFYLPPPSDQNLALSKSDLQRKFLDTYKTLHNAVEKGYKNAQEQDLNLLIASGEQHHSFHSKIIQFMLTKICGDLGIKKFLQEWPPSSFDEEGQDMPGFHIISIDSLQDIYRSDTKFSWEEFSAKKACGWKTRADAINNSIAEVNQSAFLTTGAKHLLHICRAELSASPKLSQYLILPILHATCFSLFPKDKIQLIIEKILMPKLELELTHELNILQSKGPLNLNEFKKYAEDKKSDLSSIINFLAFVNDPTILKLTDIFVTNKLTPQEIFDMMLNTLKHFHNENNASSTALLTYLEEGAEDILEDISERTKMLEKSDLTDLPEPSNGGDISLQGADALQEIES